MNRESSKLNSPARGIMLGVTTLGSAGCALLAAAIDCVFVVVQRYNRPRVVKLMERRAAK